MAVASSLWTRPLQAGVVAAPILLLVSSIAYALGGGINQDEVGGAVQVYAGFAFVIATIALGQMIGPVFPRLAPPLTGVGVLGAVGGSLFGLAAIANAMSGTHLQDTDSLPLFLGLNLPGLVFPLAMATFGVALTLGRIGPRACGPLLVVGAVLFPIARITGTAALAVPADLLLVAALVPLGVVVRTSADRTAERAGA